MAHVRQRMRHVGTALAAVLWSAVLPASGAAIAADAAIEPTPRIIGGTRAAANAWPSVGALLVRGAPGTSAFLRQFCGGTLIDSTHVLTAAHCVVNPDGTTVSGASISVLFGASDLADRGTEIGVTNVFAHPEYLPGAFYSDIAVLELETEAAGIPVVGLQRIDPDTLVGVSMDVIGWGATGFDVQGEPIYGTAQMQVRVPIVSNEACNAPTSYDGAIRDDQFCAGLIEGGIDACAGDSGGPAIVGVDGVQVQIGIVSYGRGCAEPDFYGVYTDVSAFGGFIEQYATPVFVSRSDDGPFDDDLAVGDGGLGGGSAGGSGALQPALLLAIAPLWHVLRRRERRVSAEAAAHG